MRVGASEEDSVHPPRWVDSWQDRGDDIHSLSEQTLRDVLWKCAPFLPFTVEPAGRVAKKPKQEDYGRLHRATIQLLEQQQDLRSLFREVGVSRTQAGTEKQLQKEEKEAPWPDNDDGDVSHQLF